MSPIGGSEGAHITSDLFDLTIGPYLDFSSKLGIIVDFDGLISLLAGGVLDLADFFPRLCFVSMLLPKAGTVKVNFY